VRESPTAERLLQVDKDFAKASEAKGAAEAFALFLAADAMQLPGGAHPLFGRKAIVEKPTVRYGKYVNVWRKQKDGKWKVIVDLGNPSPPPNQP